MIRALIFDMDGLMIDSERLYFQTEREMARKYHKTVSHKTLWKMMGRNPVESMRVFVKEVGLPLKPEEALEMRNKLMRVKLKTELKPMPGLFTVLNTFTGHLKMAVCTSAQQEFLDIVVDQLEIRNKFEVLQSSNEIDKGKPNPEIYLTTCRKLGLSSRDCVVLEDSSNGVLSGKRAGCYVIAIPTPYTEGQDFRKADFTAPDLFQAGKYIKNLLKDITRG
ncbi:HAD family phosphatase [bacterium]|nr:HAD family phosphatase [bacterium]